VNKLAGTLAYLMGPIDRVPDCGVEWRKNITPFLHGLEIGVLDPCDKATPYATEDPIIVEKLNAYRETARRFAEIKEFDECNETCDELHETVAEIVSYDLRQVDMCGFGILYIDKDVHMCGSYGEQTHACLQRKPVIIMCEQGKYEVPGWLWGICDHSLFFGSWGDVQQYIRWIAFHAPPIEIVKYGWKFFDFNKIYGREIFNVDCRNHNSPTKD